MSEREDAERVAVVLAPQYLLVRVLPDNSVAALERLITTHAILLGCTEGGWERRFCFEDRCAALREFLNLHSEDDVPEGYIARRGLP